MAKWKDKRAVGRDWCLACNSRDPDRIAALYSERVVYRSPRVPLVVKCYTGILNGRTSVREYWQRLLDRPDPLRFEVLNVFAGIDSVALEYRTNARFRGIEFMMLDARGLISFAVGNDWIPLVAVDASDNDLDGLI